ncbi:MAG: hypothetical protein RJA98_2579 [Pseudomonadota bacterium]|jgi:hypothetical protein
MKLTHDQLDRAFQQALLGMAKLQARQEAMECFVRALIVESPPVHPLFWKAIDTAQSDLAHRSQQARPENPPEIDAAALSLLNVLRAACAPPTDHGTSS